MATADYRNHSVSEQSNNCRVAAWEKAGPRHPTDEPAGPGWLLSLEVEASWLSRLPLMALAREGVRSVALWKQTFSKGNNPDAHSRTRDSTAAWPDGCRLRPLDNTPVTFHLSALKPNYLTITAYKWSPPPQRHQRIVCVSKCSRSEATCISFACEFSQLFLLLFFFLKINSFNISSTCSTVLFPLFVPVYVKTLRQ